MKATFYIMLIVEINPLPHVYNYILRRNVYGPYIIEEGPVKMKGNIYNIVFIGQSSTDTPIKGVK